MRNKQTDLNFKNRFTSLKIKLEKSERHVSGWPTRRPKKSDFKSCFFGNYWFKQIEFGSLAVVTSKMGGYSVMGGEYEISGKTKNKPKQFLSLRCKSYRKTNDQHCKSSIRVLIENVERNGQRILNCKFIKSTRDNFKHSKG